MPNHATVTEPLIDFHSSPEYLALTTQQRAWVDMFVETNDAKLTTLTVYQFAVPRHAEMFAYTVRKNPRIRAAVNRARGLSEHQAFLEEVHETMVRAPEGSDRKVRAQALYARLRFGVSESVEVPAKVEAPVRNESPQAPGRFSLAAPLAGHVTTGGDVAIAESPERDTEEFDEAQIYRVGDRVTQSGKRYHIAAVDADGHPTNVEELK